MARLSAAVFVCVVSALLGNIATTNALPHADSFVSVLLRVGKDGTIDRYDKVEMRQRGFDKIAIAQAVVQAKDGGRLTLPEAYKIVNAMKPRLQANAGDPLDEICEHAPLYPPCKDR